MMLIVIIEGGIYLKACVKNLLMLVCMVVTRSTTLIIEYKMTIKDMVKNIQVILYCMICRQIYQNMSLGNTVQVLK